MPAKADKKPRYDVRRPQYEWFAGRLQAARRDLGLTQKELGERVGVSTHTVTNWERACRYPKADEVRRLAAALDKPPSYFVDDETATAINEEAHELLLRFLQRAMRGEGLAAAVEAETGDPTLMDHDRRRFYAAIDPALRQWVQRFAPLAWEQMDEAAQRELLESLVAHRLPPQNDGH